MLQILINLISNARDALRSSAGPSRLRLHVGLAEDREGFVRFQVADTGIGIQPEHLTRIFSLGGVLSAYSAGAGQDATFTLDLPATPEAAPVQGPALPC